MPGPIDEFTEPTRVCDYYEDSFEVRKLLAAAQARTKSLMEDRFLAQFADSFNKFGMRTYLSEKQNNWLVSIAERK